MNIFFLHPNPRRCARWHCDKHVVKMILESCQLLYTAHWILSLDLPEPPYIHCAPNRGYKPTHANHPCSIWVRESLNNYRWLVKLAEELILEFKFRYGDKLHKCEDHVEWLKLNEPKGLKLTGFTIPKCAMPEEYKRTNPVIAYRLFYKFNKDKSRGIVQYTDRHRPSFLE
jgi:hypothetical protein